jgi:hypothetical protein
MFENLDKLFLKKEPEKARVTNEPKKIELKAQVGTNRVLKCSADICFYGGGAGGETFALLLLPLIHLVKLINFTCVILDVK